MIGVEHLFHSYAQNDQYQVEDVSFTVAEGEVFGFLGPSGAGKSTTQKILTGLLPLQKGRARIDRVDITRSTRELFNKIGVSFEQPNLYKKLTGLENLEFYRGLYSVPTADPRQLLRLLGLEEAANKRASDYSKGCRCAVPFFLFSDAGMLGLLLIAALIFFETEEGTLKAYLVTPGRIWEFLLSKALTLGVFALAFTAVLVPPTLGVSPNYLHLVAIMFLGSVLTSLLGALMAVFFENLTQFIFPALGVMAAISLPQISFFMPSFSPVWVRWIPTYPMVFGLREAAFPSGHPSTVYNAIAILVAVNLVLLLLASAAYRRKLAES